MAGKNQNTESWPSILQRIVFWAVTLALFILGVCLLLQDKPASAVVAFGAAALATLIAYLPFVEKFEFGPAGVKAELKRTLDKAQATVEQLHQVAVLNGKLMVESLGRGTRYAGQDRRKRKASAVAAIAATLRELGLHEEKINEVVSADSDWVEQDYISHIAYALAYLGLEGDDHATLSEFQKTTRNRPHAARVKPEEFQNLIDKLIAPIPEWIADLLADYAHYVRTCTHRRPEMYLNEYRPHRATPEG